MTADEREALYDAEIAPALLEVARKCEANGLSFVASVEWAPSDTGETVTVREEAGVKILMAAWAVRARGNVDSLIMAIQKYGREHGHNSAILHMLESR